MKSFAAAAGLACLLASCTQDVASDPAANDESAIVGGKKVSASDPIAHVTVAVVDPSPDVGQFCTGIVVDKDIVLSAAHCFDDASRTPYVRAGASSAHAIRVRAVAVHAQYSQSRRTKYDTTIEKVTSAAQITTPSSPLYDIALLALDEALPASVTPAVFASASADLATADLVSAGYGCTSTACRSQVDALRKVSMQWVRTAPDASLVVLEAGARHGSCFGDSGGPDFIVSASGVKVFGMISTGPESCELGISVDTLVAPYLAWVHQSTDPLRSGKSSSGFKRKTF
jgi:secreted trypsin-like serine protease